MRKIQIIVLGTVAALSLIGGGALVWKRLGPTSETLKPRIGPVVEAVYGLGTVVATQTYQVKTAVNQGIREIYVKEGDQVKTGDALIRFDDSGMYRAPFNGTVTSIPLKKGELLFPSTSALTLVNLNELFLEVSLEQQAVLRVKRDQRAIVSFESIRGERLNGKVQSVLPRDTQFIVRITLNQFPHGILPGMTADVAIEVAHKDYVLSIPLRAVSSGRVTFQREGKTIKDGVTLGVIDGDWAEVTSGNIKPNDDILVRAK